MQKIDEEILLKRHLGDNETYPNAVHTGIVIGDELLHAKAWMSAMWRRVQAFIATLPRGLRHSHK